MIIFNYLKNIVAKIVSFAISFFSFGEKQKQSPEQLTADFFDAPKGFFKRMQEANERFIAGIVLEKDIEYVQLQVAFSTRYTTILHYSSTQTLRVLLTLGDDFYLQGEKKTALEIYGRVIYGYALFVFFYIFLSLASNQHQTYVRMEWKGPSDITSYTNTVLSGTLITEDKVAIINEIIEVMNDLLESYTSEALLTVSIQVTNVTVGMFENYASNYKDYKPSALLIEKYFPSINVMG